MFHIPVLLKEVIEFLKPSSGGTYLDGTLGGGGYAEAILNASEPNGKVFGFDVDEDAVKSASSRLAKFGERIKVVKLSYAEIAKFSEKEKVKFDGIVLDLGVSSHQFDEASRGFSFQNDGPLDMRMDKQNELTAEYVLKNYSAIELAEIFEKYGEERFAKKIANRVFEQRVRMNSTKDLEEICYLAYPPPMRHGRVHPATRVFQALRIFVNSELANLETFLKDVPQALTENGRVVVVSYHSLEDRLVKNRFKEFNALTKKPVTASDDETEKNPRARSAKLRACVMSLRA